MIYNPNNWYWFVAGDTTRVYSSAVGDYVPSTDATYTQWVTDGGVATNIDTEANLAGVLAPYTLRPTTPTILDAYKDVQSSGIVVNTIAKVLFNHENRIRALEGQAAITAAQFKAGVKALM